MELGIFTELQSRPQESANGIEANMVTHYKDIEVEELFTIKTRAVIQTEGEISLRIPDPTKTPVQLALTADDTKFVYNEPVYWQIKGSSRRPEQLTLAGITIEKIPDPTELLIGVDSDFDENGDLSKNSTAIKLNDKTNFVTNVAPTKVKFKSLFSNPKKIDGNSLKNGSVINLKSGDKIGGRKIPDPNDDPVTLYYQTADMPLAEILTREGFDFLIGPGTPPNFKVANTSYIESGRLRGTNSFELSNGILKT